MAERDPLVQAALDYQKLSAEAFGMQMKREDDDLQFQVPEKQWPENIQVLRQGQTVQGVPLPPRPMLSIPTLAQPIQQVFNQWTRASMGVHVSAISKEANDETAEIIQGLYRHIEVDSRANLARGWGADRAIKCGFGCYRVDVVYDESTEDPDDLKIVIKRVLRQSSWYRDPFAVEPDFCDQKRALIVSWMSRADSKREFPKAKINSMSLDELIELQSQMPNFTIWSVDGSGFPVRGADGGATKGTDQLKWYDGANDAVCVAEFFYTEYEPHQWSIGTDGQMTLTPIAEGETATGRVIKKPVVKWCKLNAVEVLEQGTWNGKYIPIIPCVGNELQPFDTERRWAGIITPNKDAARTINYEVTNAVERDALQTKAPWIGFVGQFKTNQAAWQQANVRNFPYLEADPVVAGGTLAPLPQRNLHSPDLSSTMQLIQVAKDALQTGTAVIDTASLENLAKRKVAHQTLLGMQDQNATGQSQYVQNMADISMSYEAKVVLDLIPKIYDRPGRVARIVGEDGSRSTVMLNAPFVMSQKSQRPIQVPEGIQALPPEMGQPQTYDLTKGQYAVVVDIGKDYKTKAQEGADALGNIMAQVPTLIPVLGDIWMGYQDFPGHKLAAERMKKMLPPQLQDEGKQGQMDPQALKTQRDQAAMMVEQLSQQLQQLQKVIETEQVKAAADIEKAKMDGANRIEIERIKAATDLRIAGMKVQAEQAKIQIDAMTKAALQDDAQQHEHAESAVDRAHEHATLEKQTQLAEAQADRAARRGFAQGEVDHAHAEHESERAHARTLEQGEQSHAQNLEAQAMQPKPDGD